MQTNVEESRTEPEPAKKPSGCREAVAIWLSARKEKYGVQNRLSGRDVGRIENIITAIGGDVERFRAAVGRYMACTEDFEARSAHPLALFAKQRDRWLNDIPASAPSPRGSIDRGAQQESRILAQIAEALTEVPAEEAGAPRILNAASGELEAAGERPADVKVPSSLNCRAFKDPWSSWATSPAVERNLTADQARACLAKLCDVDLGVAVLAVKKALAAGSCRLELGAATVSF